jgi:uncharacterized protein (DUF3820 family)
MLTDESKMPFGVHKGKNMADVPASYLLWLYENNKCSGEVKEYIKDNLDVIKVEIERKAKK